MVVRTDSLFQPLNVAATYSPLASTIGTTELNFCVRNGNRCDLCVEPPRLLVRTHPRAPPCVALYFFILYAKQQAQKDTVTVTSPLERYCWRISTPPLNRLLGVHVEPINLVISEGPQRFLILEWASRLDAFSGYPVRT